jgi:hypothetical protein
MEHSHDRVLCRHDANCLISSWWQNLYSAAFPPPLQIHRCNPKRSSRQDQHLIMPSIAAIRSHNALSKIANTRSLVVGGTSGIGEAIARRLALAGSNVTIVGRNIEAGNSIVESIKEAGGTASFSQLDVSLVKNAKEFGVRFCKEESRLDYLVITAGIMKVQGRVNTSEGLDEKYSTHYFAR